MPKIIKFAIILATFLASPTTAETLSPFVPLIHTARLTATSLLLFLPDAAPAAEFIIHGRTRNHIAKVGNQRKKHTNKSRKPGKKGKGSKKRPRPPPTPRPQLRSKKPKSSRPTNALTATSNPVASAGKIFMNIRAIFNISHITVVKGRRRQLAVTTTDLTTIMKTTIQDVVRRSLNADQSLIAVNIAEIDDSSINGTTTIYSQVSLTENCTNADCEAQLSNTTMNSTVISYMQKLSVRRIPVKMQEIEHWWEDLSMK